MSLVPAKMLQIQYVIDWYTTLKGSMLPIKVNNFRQNNLTILKSAVS